MGRKTPESIILSIGSSSRTNMNNKHTVMQQDNFADRMRQLRSLANLTQSDLAEILGVTRGAIANWEKGRNRPDIFYVPMLCKALRISIEEFFSNEKISTSKEQQMLHSFRQLNQPHQDVIVNMCDQLLQSEKYMTVHEHVQLEKLWLSEDAVAAGIGAADFSTQCKPIYIHTSPVVRRADYVFKVNGDSMDPTYPDGSFVLVKEQSSLSHYGEIGIFQVQNELYIKEYRKEGLFSHNPVYPLMRKESYGDIFTIGRVIGSLDEKDFATEKEIEDFKHQD